MQHFSKLLLTKNTIVFKKIRNVFFRSFYIETAYQRVQLA